MKYTLGLLILILVSCQHLKGKKDTTKYTPAEKNITPETKQDSLFELNINEKFVEINAPKNSDFDLPDESEDIEIIMFEDFNADNKKDAFIYLGACGTGGCMYGVFLNQYKNYYNLAFFDYLKGPEFKKEENGFLSIISYEEAEPYNPSKLYVTKYILNKNTNQYEIDTSYLYIDE